MSTTLNSNSWKAISKVSKAGKAGNYWSVGDVKYEYLYYNVPTLFNIADFNVDDNNSITFTVGNQLDKYYALAKSSINNDFFDGTVYKFLTNDVLPNMPFKNYIREVSKEVYDWASRLRTYSVKIFCFSCYEVYGSYSWTKGKEGKKQYSYYKAGNLTKHWVDRTGGSQYTYEEGWWLRSVARNTIALLFSSPYDNNNPRSNIPSYSEGYEGDGSMVAAFGFVI